MRVPSMVVRIAILAILALVWWSSSVANGLAAAWDWLRAQPALSDRSLAITSLALLAIYGALLLLDRLRPRRRSANEAIAKGLVAIVVATLAALLVTGWFFHIGAMVRAVALLTIVVSIQLVASLIAEAIRARRKRRANRERTLTAEELTRLLSGTTHAIRRVSHDQPPRQWLELRHFGPDGRVASYAEGDEQTRAYPGKITWAVKDDLLEITSSLDASNPTRYRLALDPDGQFSYYHAEPGSPIDGMLEFRTAEVRNSEPSEPSAPAGDAPAPLRLQTGSASADTDARCHSCP